MYELSFYLSCTPSEDVKSNLFVFTHHLTTKMLITQFHLIFSCLLHLHFIQSAQIVFYFATSPPGHRMGVWPLVSSLVSKGHNVTFISELDSYSSNHLTSPHVHEINVKPVIDAFGPLFYFDKNPLTFRKEGTTQSIWDIQALNTLFKCEAILQNWKKLFQNLLNIKSGIDLMIIDVPNNDCAFGIAHILKTKKIILYSGQMGLFMSLPDSMGFVPETAWVPDMQRAYSFEDQEGLSYFHRLANTLRAARWHTFREVYIIPQHNKLFQKYLEEISENPQKIPSLAELEQNVNLVLYNSHHSEEFSKSLPPSIVSVGSMHIPQTPEQLPQEIQSFIGSSKFVYVSFGTQFQLPKELERLIIQSILESGLKVIIQSRNSPDYVTNAKVYMKPWLPQQAILNHKAIHLFISHGSSYALQEAIYYAVPIIVTPIQLDEDYNANIVEKHGVGVKLEISSLSSPRLKNILNQLQNSQLKSNIIQLSSFSKERPIPPLDLAIWWTEYVLRRTPQETRKLRSQTAINLSWIQRRLIDVWAIAIILATISTSGLAIFLLWVVKRLYFSWNINANAKTELKLSFN